jgi:acetate kinase
MAEYALVLNAGSSSLKFCVYQRAHDAWHTDVRGALEGLGRTPTLSARDDTGTPVVERALPSSVTDASAAIDVLGEWLRARFGSVRVVAVGHRVVHGGTTFTGPVVVSPAVIAGMRNLVPLAPLHQPFNIAAIEAAAARLPGVPQVACFDTSFHNDRAPVTRVVPLPREVCGDHIQRYGFHGLSYEYIASVLPEVAPSVADRRVIVAHLGSGASLCAMHNRRSVDTTLGFTALDGLCMGTRPGAVDPGVILYLFQNLGLSAKEVEAILYKRSGLLGISGSSNDMRELLASGTPEARLAVDYFVHRAVKEIGALTAVLGGLDALVFTAGIGERSAAIRDRICAGCAWLGVQIDDALNGQNATRISQADSRVPVWVIPTDEELMIARHMTRVLGLAGAHT